MTYWLLTQSRFRSRFRLGVKESAYLDSKSVDIVMEHAAGFIHNGIAPAEPKKDGRQTPMRGHPVFIAQHATATCCRGCLAKWKGIAVGHILTQIEVNHVLATIRRLESQRPTT